MCEMAGESELRISVWSIVTNSYIYHAKYAQ